MMTTLETAISRLRQVLLRFRTDRRLLTGAKVAGSLAAGFALSAASLGNYAQPIAMAAVCAWTGWLCAPLALGSALGYLLFWGEAGQQGLVWLIGGVILCVCVNDRPIARSTSLLLPSAAALVVAVSGVVFQIWAGDKTPIAIYGLRILMAGVAVGIFAGVRSRKDPVSRWLCCGLWVLSLAQIAPLSWLGLGFVAAGALGLVGSLPAATLSGLALDLAQVTPVPMTAVLCLPYFMRLIPRMKKSLLHGAPGTMYLVVMALCGKWDLLPLPALLLGSFATLFVTDRPTAIRRRGETGVAQVRLEMVAGALSQAQLLLTEAQEPPIDYAALMSRCAQRACGSCPCRKNCREKAQAEALPHTLLQQPLTDAGELPFSCRKPGRLLMELHRTREHLRTLQANRGSRADHRWAVVQQYRFLSGYLRELSDDLGQRLPQVKTRFQPEVAFCANRRQSGNGDRCLQFPGVGGSYYVAVCDGMGTGLGAVEEGKNIARMLQKLLSAGFPPEHALRSLNDLCVLRGTPGAATVDLCRLQLDSGKVFLYKWGAGPSYVLSAGGCEKIGTTSPPPGISITEGRETVERLSLRRGQTLVLVSDGVGGEDALRCCFAAPEEPLGELAARLLELGDPTRRDDATVAAIRLREELPGSW